MISQSWKYPEISIHSLLPIVSDQITHFKVLIITDSACNIVNKNQKETIQSMIEML